MQAEFRDAQIAEDSKIRAKVTVLEGYSTTQKIIAVSFFFLLVFLKLNGKKKQKNLQ